MADIELVIKIPEEMYKRIALTPRCASFFDAFNDRGMFVKAIQNGKPLPKGHGDLIDVDRKITVSVYDEQYEEWGEKTLTVLEALNRWSDEGVTIKDVVIPAEDIISERW